MDATSQPLLDIRDLSVAFRQGGRETLAVDRISFRIDKGQCVALVGESGSGKSVNCPSASCARYAATTSRSSSRSR
jgi:microcin C transport system ATP-binding protein